MGGSDRNHSGVCRAGIDLTEMQPSHIATSRRRDPRILLITPEITSLPNGMGDMAHRLTAKAGGLADVSASLVSALFDLGADVHVALPHYRRLFHVDVAPLISEELRRYHSRLPNTRIHLAEDRIFYYRDTVYSGYRDELAKIAILSSLAFGTKLEGDEIAREGISGIRSVDVEFARRSGYVIKLLGIAERIGDSGLSRRVHPTLVPKEHPLASVNGAMNAVFVDGAKSGPLMWLGQGAGGEPTATAVLGDVLDAARNRVSDRHDIPFTYDNRLHFVDEGELRSAFYISIDVDDEPGVLAAVANIFAEQGVSILSMEQSGEGAEARMSFVTHEARTESVRATIHALSDLPKVERVGACLRVLAGGL